MFNKQGAGLVCGLYRLVGPKVGALVAISVPAGVVLGGVEIVTASVLYAVLAEFNLVVATPFSSAVTFGLNPVIALFVFTILAALLRYASQTLPILSDYALTTRLREALVHSTLGGVTERSVISVSETSHLLANVVPRGGEFVNGLATFAATLCLVLLVLLGLFRMSWQLTIIALGFGGTLALVLVLLRRSYGKYVESIHPFLRKFNMAMIRAARNNHLLRVNGVNEKEAETLIVLSKKSQRREELLSLVRLEQQHSGTGRNLCRRRCSLAECPACVCSGGWLGAIGLPAIPHGRQHWRTLDSGRATAAKLALHRRASQAYGRVLSEKRRIPY